MEVYLYVSDYGIFILLGNLMFFGWEVLTQGFCCRWFEMASFS